MANLAQVIYEKVNSVAGTYVDGRVYPVVVPPNAQMPAITYRQVYGAHMRPSPLFRSRWQVDIIGPRLDEVQDIRAVVVAGLRDWRDITTTPRIIDTNVDMEFNVFDGELALHRHIIDIGVDSE